MRRRRNIDWNDSNISLLVELYGTETAREIGKRLGCSPDAVIARAQKIGLRVGSGYFQKKNQFREYTTEEDEFIVNSHEKRSAREVADALGRGMSSIWGRARFLDVKFIHENVRRAQLKREREAKARFPSFAGQNVSEPSTGIYQRPKAVSYVPTESNS